MALKNKTLWAAGFAAALSVTGQTVWYSDPVKPGDTVLVFGAGFSNVQATLDGHLLPRSTGTDECFTFTLPEDLKQNLFRVKVGDETLELNSPKVWWIQGDKGDSVLQGGLIRVFGRGIAFNSKAYLELGGVKCEANGDLFSMEARVPKDLKPGVVSVVLHNGFVRKEIGRFTIRSSWRKKSGEFYNVVDYGARPNDLADDTKPILAALEAIGKAGGGKLYFPRGRFGMRGTIVLPPNTTLVGEGMDLSQIYWADEDDPKGALISGTVNFGIENVSLCAGNIDRGIVTEKADKNEWVSLINVRTRFLHTDSGAEEGLRRQRQKGALALSLHADHLEIAGCDFYASKGSSGISGTYVRISGSKFGGPDCAYYSGRYFVFEDNNHLGQSMSFGNGSRDCYIARNRFGNCFGDGDRETFTLDGGRPTFEGTARCAGLKMTLSEEGLKRFGWLDGQDSWIGRPVYIYAGKGRGQYRDIVKFANRTDLEIASPWTVVPDETSQFCIAKNRYQLIFANNLFFDGNPFTMYGSAVDVILYGNRMYRNSGMAAHSLDDDNPKVAWFIQFLKNEIMEGNTVRGPQSFQNPARDSLLTFFSGGSRFKPCQPLAMGGVLRGNVLRSNASILCWGHILGLLIDDNQIEKSDLGVQVYDSNVRAAVVRRTRFDEVVAPYRLGGTVEILPEDRLSVMKYCFEAVLKIKWDGYETCGAALSALKERDVSPEVFEMLSGINVVQMAPWDLERLASGKVKDITLWTSLFYPAGMPPAELTARAVSPASGWAAPETPAQKLVPGETVTFKGVRLQRPDDVPTTVEAKVNYRLRGEGWELRTQSPRYGKDLVAREILVSGPFAYDESPEGIENLLRRTRQAWTKIVSKDEWSIPDVYSVLKPEGDFTVLGKAVIRTTQAITVRLDFNGNKETKLYLNGERVGSSTRRDSLRCVDLKPGENIVEIVRRIKKGGDGGIKLIVTPVDTVPPLALTFGKDE